MLRITQRSENESRLHLILEGWLGSDSLPVLEEALEEARRQSVEITLDLGHVSYVDRRAAGFLRALRREGVRMVGASEVLNELVED